MARGSTIIWGKDELTRAPAPDAEHIRRDFNSASAQPGSNTSPGLCGKLRSQGLAAGKMTLQTYPMVDLSVGLREGRLSERSPAFPSSGRASGHSLSVQGGRLSHSFLTARAKLKLAKLAQAMLDVFAGSFWLLYVALWIVVILGVLPFTVFCLFLIQF
jgi:hypothetical protein